MAKQQSTVREKLLGPSRRSLKREPVEVNGHTVWAWELTWAQKNRAKSKVETTSRGEVKPESLSRFQTALVIEGTRDSGDEGAARVFDENDGQYLNQQPSSDLEKLLETVSRLSGMLPASVEDAEKNSETTPSCASSSDSLLPLASPIPGDSGSHSVAEPSSPGSPTAD